MENILQRTLMVLVIALMSTFSFGFDIHLYHNQTQNVYTMGVEDTTMIQKVRQDLANNVGGGAQPNEISIMYMSTNLMDNQTISSYQIKDNDTLNFNYHPKQQNDDNKIYSNSKSFHDGELNVGIDTIADGSGTFNFAITLFGTGNHMDTLGAVHIIETTPNANSKLASNIFLTLTSNGSGWQFDPAKGSFTVTGGVPITKDQRMAMDDDKRDFEISILDSKGKDIASTLEQNTKEDEVDLYSYHDKLIGGDVKMMSVEKDAQTIDVTFIFNIDATEEVVGLLGAAHFHASENINHLNVSEDSIYQAILEGTEWTFNANDNSYMATKMLNITKEKYWAIDTNDFHINVHDANGAVILTSEDEDFFELNSRDMNIEGGLAEIGDITLNPDSSGVLNMTFFVDGNNDDLGKIVMYADSAFKTFKEGDVYLELSDGSQWTFNTAKKLFVADLTIQLTKEQLKGIFFEDLDLYINIHESTDPKKVLLTTLEPKKVWYKFDAEKLDDREAYANGEVMMYSDGTAEVMLNFWIKSDDDLSNALGNTHFHTLFELGQLAKNDVFKGILTADDWFYDGVKEIYVAEKKLMLSAEEAMAFCDDDNLIYINIHDKNTNAVTFTSAPDTDELDLYTGEDFVAEWAVANLDNDNTGIYLLFTENDGEPIMHFSFMVKAGLGVDDYLGASHIHVSDSVPGISAGGVLLPILEGTEWEYNAQKGMYTAEKSVKPTQEQLAILDKNGDDLYINIHHKQNSKVTLSTNNAFAFDMHLYATHDSLDGGRLEGLFMIDPTTQKITMQIQVAAKADSKDPLPILGNGGFYATKAIGNLAKDALFLQIFNNPTWTYNSKDSVYVTEATIPVSQEQIDSLDMYDFHFNILDKVHVDEVILTSIPMMENEEELYVTNEFTNDFSKGNILMTIMEKEDGSMDAEMKFMVESKIQDALPLLGASHVHTDKAIGQIAAGGIFKAILDGSEWTYDTQTKMYIATKMVSFTKEEAALLKDDSNEDNFYFNIHKKGTGEVMFTTKKMVTSIVEETTSNVTIGTSVGAIHILTDEDATVTVYDVLGRVITSTSIEGTTEISTNGATGTHIVIVETENGLTKETVVLY